MNVQKNLAVLRQYYQTLAYPGALVRGDIYSYVAVVASQDKMNEDSVDARALIACCKYLQENGFSDLYLNGRRQIATKYGAVPLEMEICFAIENDAVSSFRIELFLRYTKLLGMLPDGARLCGRWRWDVKVGFLVAEVPLDMSRVIWGVAK